MELDFLLKIVCGIFGTLISNMLFGSGSPDQAPDKEIDQHLKSPVVMAHHMNRDELSVPPFVTSVPDDHFAGVSAPMPSLGHARKSAVDDVVRQVLGAIGIEYNHQYVDRISGSVRDPKRNIEDRLSGFSHGVVLGIERNIVKSSWFRDDSGRYVYFVLVYYPGEKIREMRRLSKGAKVFASVVTKHKGDVRLKVWEVNGVSVVLTSARIIVRKKNRFAKAISFFVWHVPSGSEHDISMALGPIRVCGDSREVTLSLSECDKNLEDYLLGAKLERLATLKGHDELGRPVLARVSF
ncbi:hypothetical protein TRIP_B350162 [uncultured Desulfatiglans sp.]|uniref:Uncharacterized protein n=1 Tax=Uncultured Desulfatiglans sp. TaxID=1748965 RepID=A0A653AAK0_UNCDX|nr:hypothetical protein TRIP_B350162 [uncultured Desulfatiglans sp.]